MRSDRRPRSGILLYMSNDAPPLFLFDLAVPAAPADATAVKPSVVECSECGRVLRSEKSIEAGVGPGCAAKAGRVVIISMRRSKSRQRRRQGAAAA